MMDHCGPCRRPFLSSSAHFLPCSLLGVPLSTKQSVREVELASLHGRKIAIDASMAIYQFLIAVRSGGGNQQAFMLTNEQGETTSHLQGMFNRTIRFMTEGIKPVFVFDGKPPTFKSGELLKRKEKREKAEEELKKAHDEGDIEEENKQSKRLVRAGRKENDDCKKLLQLMGMPIVLAPCEAEAQAAALAKAGKVYATGTEDMDAVTFATPILIRKMTFANAKNGKVQSINYAKALEGLGLTHDEFVDLCILLGCDYCDPIKGIGPKTALKLVREHGSIEKILENIGDASKYTIPDDWVPSQKKDDSSSGGEEGGGEEKRAADEEEEFIPVYVQARKLFNEHEVLADVELKWKPCDPDGLTKFLVDEQGFDADRVQKNIVKLQDAYKKNQKPQMRMDNFFAIKPSAPKAKPNSSSKRKPDPAKGGKKKAVKKR